MKPVLKKTLQILAVTAFWLGLWGLAAFLVDKPLLFPYPWRVLHRLGELLLTAEFYATALRSLCNVLVGILIAILFGILLAILTHRVRWARQLLLPLMTVIKTTPIVSFIILAILWIGAGLVPSFITFLIVLPIVWSNLDMALARIDPQLIELSQVYRMSPIKRLQHLILPSVMPYFFAACRTSVGLAWKAGIAAEVITVPLATIGAMLSDAKQYLEAVDMFAWTLVVILLSLLLEGLFSRLLSRLSGNTKAKED